MKALLLVDLQNDFLPGGALAVPDGDQVVPVANALIEHKNKYFDYVIASQDWHPQGHESFASSHGERKPGDVILLGEVQQVLWPDHCVQGTAGADFVGSLNILHFDSVFKKGTKMNVDSYSAFFDNVARRHAGSGRMSLPEARSGDTGLNQWLKSKRVDELTVMGLATDYCVLFSVLDALELGFKVRVLSDGCRAVDVRAGDGDRALQAMWSAGAEITTSAKLLAKT